MSRYPGETPRWWSVIYLIAVILIILAVGLLGTLTYTSGAEYQRLVEKGEVCTAVHGHVVCPEP